MKVYDLIINLKSELCVASGTSIAGLVDIEVAHQNGFPLIPAKRLKGALHGVARELIDWKLADSKEVRQLFGKAGAKAPSPLQVLDAVLYQPDPNDSNYEIHIDEVNHAVLALQEKEAEEILELFTSIRTRTAIEEGTAEPHSLRSIRTVHKGIAFKSKIILADENHAELLVQCVKGLRGLGVGRTRGLGEVVCQLIEQEEEVLDKRREVAAINKSSVTTSEVAFRLTLEQPLLIAGTKGLYHSSESWIPGSAMLGALAGMYIADHKLGENAHEDEAFSRIFLRDGVMFDYSYPERDGCVFAPCPRHLQQNKKNPNEVYHVVGNEHTERSNVILRSLSSLVYLEDSTIYSHEPNKEIRMHHTRPTDRGIGRALGEEKRKQTDGDPGQFFQYTAISKGQTFYGTWRGRKEDLAALLACVNRRNGQLRLGRSRTAEYGTVKLKVVKPKHILTNKLVKSREYVALCLITPMLLVDSHGRPLPDPKNFIVEIEEKFGIKLVVSHCFVKQTVLSGYNGKWRMPKQQVPALDAGTVIVIKNAGLDWKEIEQQSWGLQTGIGNGRVKVMDVEQSFFHLQKVSFIPSGVQKHPRFASWVNSKILVREKTIEDASKGRKKALDFIKSGNLFRNVNQTTIHQMEELSEMQDEEKVEAIVKHVTKQSKKTVMEKMMEDCRDKSIAFKNGYFQTLKFELRRPDRV